MQYQEEEIDYDEQIDLADDEIAAGDFVDHNDIEELFRKRREHLTQALVQGTNF